MSILWCGGEDIDFPYGTNYYTISETAVWFRSTYARCCIQTNLGTTGFVRSNSFPGGEVTNCWLSVRYKFNGNEGISLKMFGLGDSNTANSGLYIGTSSASATRFAIMKFDGSSTTQLAAETGNSIASPLAKIDFHLQSYGVSATVDIYIDGVNIIHFEGDVSISGTTGFDCIFIAATAMTNAYSEFIVGDNSTDTRSLSLVTNYPSGAGDANEWDGTYASIDEVTLSDPDALYTNTDNENVQVALSNLPAGSWNVIASRVAARCCKSIDASITQVKLGIKSGGLVDVDAGRVVATAPYYTTYERLMLVNPVTSNPFTQSEIDALQLAFRSAT